MLFFVVVAGKKTSARKKPPSVFNLIFCFWFKNMFDFVTRRHKKTCKCVEVNFLFGKIFCNFVVPIKSRRTKKIKTTTPGVLRIQWNNVFFCFFVFSFFQQVTVEEKSLRKNLVQLHPTGNLDVCFRQRLKTIQKMRFSD